VHWKVLAASDFLTVEVWTGRGLITHYLLFVMSLADRVVSIAGITTRPDESWMLQIARNVTDSQSGAVHAKRYLIIDRAQTCSRGRPLAEPEDPTGE
jgi:putative transposase